MVSPRGAASLVVLVASVLGVASVEDASLPVWGDALGSLLDDRAPQQEVSYVRPLGGSLGSLERGLRDVSVEVRTSVALDAVDPYELNADDTALGELSTAIGAVVERATATSVAVRNVEATEREDAALDAPSATIAFTVVISRKRRLDAEAIAELALADVKRALTAAVDDGSLQEVLEASRAPTTSTALDAARVAVALSVRLVAESTATFSEMGQVVEVERDLDPSDADVDELEVEDEIRRLQLDGLSLTSYSYEAFNETNETETNETIYEVGTPAPTSVAFREASITIVGVVCPVHFQDDDLFLTYTLLSANDNEAAAMAAAISESTTFFDMEDVDDVTFAAAPAQDDFCLDEGLSRRRLLAGRRLDDSMTPQDTATEQTTTATKILTPDDADLNETEAANSILSDLVAAIGSNTTCDVYEEERALYTNATFNCGLTSQYTVTVTFMAIAEPTVLPTPLPSPMPTQMPTTLPIPAPTLAPTDTNVNTLYNQACSFETVYYGHRFARAGCNLLDELFSEPTGAGGGAGGGGGGGGGMMAM